MRADPFRSAYRKLGVSSPLTQLQKSNNSWLDVGCPNDDVAVYVPVLSFNVFIRIIHSPGGDSRQERGSVN